MKLRTSLSINITKLRVKQEQRPPKLEKLQRCFTFKNLFLLRIIITLKLRVKKQLHPTC